VFPPEGLPVDRKGLVLVHQVRDWCSGAAADFGWMRDAKRENPQWSLTNTALEFIRRRDTFGL